MREKECGRRNGEYPAGMWTISNREEDMDGYERIGKKAAQGLLEEYPGFL